MTIPLPGPGEYGAFFNGYIGKSDHGDVLGQLERQVDRFETLGRTLTDAQAHHRYAPGKWSVKEILGHLSDGERIFAYRALRASRGDKTPMAGFEENDYVAAANFDRRATADLVGELVALRRGTIALFRGMDDEALARIGVANDNPISARAIAHIIAGHTEHHLGVLRERYGIPA